MEAAYNALSRLQPDEKRRALLWLWEKLEIGGAAPTNTGAPAVPTVVAPSPTGAGTQMLPAAASSPKSFLAQKDPKTDLERMTCLAYYLTHYRSTPKFKTRELAALNTDAAWPNFSNPGVAVANATASKYLSPAGGGKKQITVQGERLVDALPDREKVKNLPTKRRRKSSKKKGTKG